MHLPLVCIVSEIHMNICMNNGTKWFWLVFKYTFLFFNCLSSWGLPQNVSHVLFPGDIHGTTVSYGVGLLANISKAVVSPGKSLALILFACFYDHDWFSHEPFFYVCSMLSYRIWFTWIFTLSPGPTTLLAYRHLG